jgi:hypothetical protein
VTDMTKRKGLYHAAFAFLTTVAKHPNLVAIVLEKRRTIKGGPGLQALGDVAKRHELKVDRSSAGLAPSLISCGQQAHKHAKTFAGLTSNPAIMKDVYSGGNENTVALCRELLLFYQAVKATDPSAIKAVAPASKDPWTAYAEENRVTYTDDVLENHMFRKEFSGSRESPRGRMTFLWKELTTLTSSL